MKKTLLVCGLFLSVVGARADDLAQQIVGRWAKQGDAAQTIEFYGAGIGTEAGYFHYEFPSTNEVAITHSRTGSTPNLKLSDNDEPPTAP